MTAMVMVRAGNKQNAHIAIGMAAVAEMVTALAIQQITVLSITIGATAQPVISLQFDERLKEALGNALMTRVDGSNPSTYTRIKPLGGCMLEWIEPEIQTVVVH